MVIEGKFTSKMEKPLWQDMVLQRIDFITAGDQSGWAALSSATIPATCGVAIDVPLIILYVLILIAGFSGTYAANIFVPGAAISGYKLLQYQKVMPVLSLGNLNFLEGAK
nr:hypothetical protein LSAT_8X115540 [Ipomoea batatas]